MIRSPLGLRINRSDDRSTRDQIQESARLGAKGVVLDGTGDLSPDRLSETGRRDLKHLLRSTELTLVALNLPTRRSFDNDQELEDRLARADRAFALAYELGARLVLARVGAVPPESEAVRRASLVHALLELGKLADHRGIRIAIETGTEAGTDLRAILEFVGSPGLAASADPGALLRTGHDPVSAVVSLGPWVAHAYATDATGPSGRSLIANPRGHGFPPGALDWEEYLGALEEIDYRGFLTIWPDPVGDQAGQFSAVVDRLKRF
jgi:sugar phosphate isomerase/epimerase